MLKTLHFIKARATVIYEELPENKITFSISQCSKKDQYSRKRGAEEAALHYSSGNRLTIRFRPMFKGSIRSFFYSVVSSLDAEGK